MFCCISFFSPLLKNSFWTRLFNTEKFLTSPPFLIK
uniref:Uncharacterized protein n=1 Tax=Siphoviridae sp. ctC6Q17 TaxID=2827271 RepID=A0A8S5R3N3_9CAUD|nr:MAG TPA: hypothetical protein [Siphoviridae sp. ctC6Q17]